MTKAVTVRSALIWLGLAIALGAPTIAAAFSPLLAWRDGTYVAASFAGILALCILFLQPLLMADKVPGLKGRHLHPRLGGLLVILVIIHVGALWLTSPPDVIDALLFTSPTPFSAWGVVAMWATFAAALIVFFRRKMGLRWAPARRVHLALTTLVVAGTVVHAWLIEGLMEPITKAILSGLVVLAAIYGFARVARR